MTSLAFGAGVVPLIFATGAGAASRYEIGMSVFGSVVFGTLLVPLFTVFFFVVVHSLPSFQWSVSKLWLSRTFKLNSRIKKDNTSF